MTSTQDQPGEHNPDGLSPADYGAPEWRLLKLREKSQVGDEWWDRGRWAKAHWIGLIPATLDTYRRRVTPAVPAPEPTFEQFQKWGKELEGCLYVSSASDDREEIAKADARALELEKLIESAPFEYDGDGNPIAPAQSYAAPEPAAQADIIDPPGLRGGPGAQLRAIEDSLKEPAAQAVELLPTPRTDAEATGPLITGVSLGFARKLERELASLRQQLATALRERDAVEKAIPCGFYYDESLPSRVRIMVQQRAKQGDRRTAAETALAKAEASNDSLKSTVNSLLAASVKVIAERDAAQHKLTEIQHIADMYADVDDGRPNDMMRIIAILEGQP